MTVKTIKTAEDFRVELARHQIKRYVLAGRMDYPPYQVGALISGAMELTPELAERMEIALEAILKDRAEAKNRG